MFRPDDSITRAEALAIILNSAGIVAPEGQTTTFTDIPASTNWAIRYIAKAKDL
jgi:hypothetical protein